MALARALASLLAALLFAVLFLVLLAQVVLRPFGIGLAWGEEFATFAFVVLVFLGIAVAHGRHDQLAVGFGEAFAMARLPVRARRAWSAGIVLVEIAFLALVAVGVGLMARQSWGMFAGSLSGFRFGHLYLGVLAGVLLSLAFLAHDLAVAWRTGRRPAPDPEP